MTDPPAPPGPSGGHDATQSFPAGGAPPPPPTAIVPSAPPPPQRGYPQPAPDPIDPGPAPYPVGPGAPGSVGAGSVGAWHQPNQTTGGYGAVPPTPAPAQTQPRPPRRTGRVVGRALLVLVVIGALAGTTAWGFVNRSSAERWKDRSEQADEDLRRALDRVDVTSDDLDDARARLRDLANEKAGETDRNRILSDIVAQAPEVTAALSECQQETTALANDIIDAFRSAGGEAGADPAVVAELQDRTDEVNEICAAALDQAEQLETAIEGLDI